MRIAIAAAVALLALSAAAHAKDMKGCNADWSALKKAKTAGSQTHKQFMTTCLAAGSPGVAPAPAAMPMSHPSTMAATPTPGVMNPNPAAAPSGSTALCKDGTYSHSAHHSGSCSRHGGVAKFLH